MPTLRLPALLLGLILLLLGLVLNRPWQALENINIVGAVLWALLLLGLALAARRVIGLPVLAAVAMLALLPLWQFAGLGTLAAVALLSLAAIGLGSLVVGERAPDALLSALVGLGLVAGVAAWLLPFPVFHPLALSVPLLAIVGARRAAIALQFRATLAALSADAVAAPRMALAFAVVVAVAAMPAWLPPMMADDLALHLQLPAQLAADGVYRFDVGSQVWSLSPMLGDVLQGLVRVLGGGDAIGPLNSLWLLAAALGVQRIGVALGLDARLSWLGAMLYASLPLSGGLAMGLQSELPSAALVAAMALTILRAPERSEPRTLCTLAVLSGFLLGLKVLNGAFIAPLAVLLLWRWRGQLPWRALPLAIGLGLVTGAASYSYAWVLAGNPLLPLFNATFGSPWFPVYDMVDSTWVKGLDALLPYRLTFQSGDYFEGVAGSAGFVLVALIGGVIGGLADARLRPWLLVALVAWLLPLTQLQYLRYAHPAMVLLVPVLFAGLASAGRNRLLSAAAIGLVGLQLLFQPAVSWILRGKAIAELVAEGPEAPMRRFAPERLLALRANALLQPGDRILIASRVAPYRAEFGHRAFVTNWYDVQLQSLVLDDPDEARGWRAAIAHSGANHLLVRGADATAGLRAVLSAHTARAVARVGDVALYRLDLPTTPGTLTTTQRQHVLQFPLGRASPSLVDADVVMGCDKPLAPVAISWTLDPGSADAVARHAWVICGRDGRAVSSVQWRVPRGASQLVFMAHPVHDADPPVTIQSQGLRQRRDLGRERDLGRRLRTPWCPAPACAVDRARSFDPGG